MRNRKLFPNARPSGNSHSVTPHPTRPPGHEVLWWGTDWCNADGNLNENSLQELERWHWKKVLAAMADS